MVEIAGIARHGFICHEALRNVHEILPLPPEGLGRGDIKIKIFRARSLLIK
jgi:hypothetical protein